MQFCFGQIGFEDLEVTDFTDSMNSYLFADINFDGQVDIVTYGIYSIDWYENSGINVVFLRKKVITEEVYGTYSIAILDFDNDGDDDIVSASQFDNKLAWYENTNGLGTFGPQQLITISTSSIGFVYAVDVDNDNDLDLIHQSGSTTIWLENTQSSVGNFTNEQDLPNVNEFGSSLDLDNDGDSDLVGFSYSGFYWYENIGAGVFNSRIFLISNANVRDLDFDDIDNDGDYDIVFYSELSSGSLRIYTNDGSGNLSMTATVSTTANSTENKSIELSDIDNDMDLDILLTINEDLYFSENINNSNSFSNINLIAEDFIVLNNVKSTDLTNNGNQDVIILSRSRTLSLLENIGNQNFSDRSIITSDVGFSEYVIAADLNGDGNKDVIFSSLSENVIGWYENLGGDQLFGPQQIIFTEPGIPKNIITADIDNDGDQDLVAITPGTQYQGQEGKVMWIENLDGLGNFASPDYIEFDPFDEPYSLAVFDMDNDGDQDVCVLYITAFDGDELYWYENTNGSGDFGSKQSIQLNIGEQSEIKNFDLDGDGDQDILSYSRLDDSVSWLEHVDGNGNFSSPIIISNNALSVNEAHATDLDSDGDIDVMYMSNENDDSIFWHENLNGLGNFGDRILISSEIGVNGSTAISSEDLDNDGDQDIVTSSRSAFGGSEPDEILWIENINGLATFDPPKIISIENYWPLSIFITDMDNDGDKDILSSSRGSDKIFWHDNIGIVSNEISGYVRLNTTNDECSSVNLGVSNLMVTTVMEDVSYSTYTLDNEFTGFYQIFVGSGEFTTSISSSIPNYYVSNPNSFSSTFDNVGGLNSIDFCIEPIATVTDLEIAIYPAIIDPRPGFNTWYLVVYRNIGTTNLSGDVIFEFDESKLQLLQTNQTIASQTSNTLVFDFVDLIPFETRTIFLKFNVLPPPTNNNGDELSATATINPVSGDETEEDNVFTLDQTLIGSYDPNDITVLEGDQILLEDADKHLHYLIRFQNTGTASAINVRVENVLDDKLDWTTMQLESLSHDGRVEIIDQTDVSFIFNNINLADSTSDEPNSHGFIAYKIKPKDDVVLGDVFSSTAAIYFDFNPPIITNTVTTEIVETLSVDDFESNLFSVYPNPTNSELTVNSTYGFDSLTIIDINGRILNMVSNKNRELNMFINVEDFANGIYFLKIKAANTEQTLKFIKN
ncbi:FG-GAP repeat domain-containing protein [Psychroserpens burtonensis]|uniref:FG-GAP repeat domain-containing protein n=1 Tax=Psychroserpens burtonensis TaxID=49278 RepID=UPI00068776E8|nr:VCBS repeat-containing protein [Psychroserpens burtonensis]